MKTAPEKSRFCVIKIINKEEPVIPLQKAHLNY